MIQFLVTLPCPLLYLYLLSRLDFSEIYLFIAIRFELVVPRGIVLGIRGYLRGVMTHASLVLFARIPRTASAFKRGKTLLTLLICFVLCLEGHLAISNDILIPWLQDIGTVERIPNLW